MIRSLKGGLYVLAGAIATPLALISAEKALSHLLFKYAIKFAPKSSHVDDHQDDE
jgi:hypothetical protein